MLEFESIYSEVIKDSRYLVNLSWVKPRKGHPEATVKAHIEELERNLHSLNIDPSKEEFWKLRALIHVNKLTFRPTGNHRKHIPVW